MISTGGSIDQKTLKRTSQDQRILKNSAHASTMEAHHNFHSVHPCCGWFWCEIPRQITLQLYNIDVEQTIQNCHQLGGWSLLWHHPTLEPQEVIS